MAGGPAAVLGVDVEATELELVMFDEMFTLVVFGVTIAVVTVQV